MYCVKFGLKLVYMCSSIEHLLTNTSIMIMINIRATPVGPHVSIQKLVIWSFAYAVGCGQTSRSHAFSREAKFISAHLIM